MKQAGQQRRPQSSNVMSATDDVNSFDRLTHGVNQPAAESAAMATSNVSMSNRQQSALMSVVNSSHHQPLVGFFIVLIIWLVISD